MAIKRGGMKRNMLNLHIQDEQTLYSSYMGYLKHGGIFVPTEKNYRLGQEVFVVLTILDDSNKIAMAGKVVWINPKGAQGNRPAGIGLHFPEKDKDGTRDLIEKLIASYAKSEKPTYTM